MELTDSTAILIWGSAGKSLHVYFLPMSNHIQLGIKFGKLYCYVMIHKGKFAATYLKFADRVLKCYSCWPRAYTRTDWDVELSLKSSSPGFDDPTQPCAGLQ